MGIRVFTLSGSYQGMDALDGKPGRNSKDKSKKGSQQRNSHRSNQNNHKRNNQPSTSCLPDMPSKPHDYSQTPQRPDISIIPTENPSFNVSNMSTPKHQHRGSLERSSGAGIIGSKPMTGSSNNLLNSPSLLRSPIANPTLKHSPNLANKTPGGLNSYASIAHRPHTTLSNIQFTSLSTPPQLHATTSYSAANTPANGKVSDFTPFTTDLPKYSPISDYKTIEAFNKDTLRAGLSPRPAQRDLSHTSSFSGSGGTLGLSLSSLSSSPSRNSSRVIPSAPDLPPLSMTPSSSTQSGASNESSPIEPLQLDFMNNYTNYNRLIPRSSVSQSGPFTLPNHYNYYNGMDNCEAAPGAGYTIDNYSARSELALNNFMQQLDINSQNAAAHQRSKMF